MQTEIWFTCIPDVNYWTRKLYAPPFVPHWEHNHLCKFQKQRQNYITDCLIACWSWRWWAAQSFCTCSKCCGTKQMDQVCTSLFLLGLGCFGDYQWSLSLSHSAWGQCTCMVQSSLQDYRPGLQIVPMLWDSGPGCSGNAASAFVSCASKAAHCRELLCCTAAVALLLFIYICRERPGKKDFGSLS